MTMTQLSFGDMPAAPAALLAANSLKRMTP